MNTQTESYKINGSGLLEGGNVSYTADLDNGEVCYSGNVKIGVGIFAKNEAIPPGNYPVGAANLLSSAASKVGDTINVGPAHLCVTHVDGSIATVSVVIDQITDTDPNKPSHGALDISGQYIKLISLTAFIKYSGMSIAASLQRV